MIYELVIEDEKQDGIYAISLVHDPAIESGFVYFDKQKIEFAEVSKEKRLVMGPILIPDKKIFRIDGQGFPYEVFFSKDTVRRLSQMYLEQNNTGNATLEHEKKIKGVTLIESWITESQISDKSKLYNLTVPVGTWMGTFLIDKSPDGEKIWNDFVKTGKVKGFSIEGLFEHKLYEASAVDILEKDIVELSDIEANAVLRKIKHFITSDGRYAKGKRVDKIDMEGVQPTISTSYPGQGPSSKKKKI